MHIGNIYALPTLLMTHGEDSTFACAVCKGFARLQFDLRLCTGSRCIWPLLSSTAALQFRGGLGLGDIFLVQEHDATITSATRAPPAASMSLSSAEDDINPCVPAQHQPAPAGSHRDLPRHVCVTVRALSSNLSLPLSGCVSIYSLKMRREKKRDWMLDIVLGRTAR